MDTISLPVYDIEGKEVDSIKLDNSIFGVEINTAAIHQAVNAYRANQRKGLAATKTRGEVSGGGRKPWKQKGTGRARVGSTRSPLWRHGGVVFGPHPRDFSVVLPKKIKAEALKSVLSAKVSEGNMLVLDKLNIEQPKTKAAIKILSNLKMCSPAKKNKVLVLSEAIDKNMNLSLRNINLLKFSLAKDTNAYEVVDADKLIITKLAVKELTDRIKNIK